MQGTLNGLGERCGNANLCSLIPNLMLKPGFASRFETGLSAHDLAQITHVIGAADANISNLRIYRTAPDFSDILIDVEVADLKHLIRVISGLRAQPVVSAAQRVNG